MVEPYLEEAPFEELRDDSLVVGVAPSIDHFDPICTEPLDVTFTPLTLHHALPLACIP